MFNGTSYAHGMMMLKVPYFYDEFIDKKLREDNKSPC